MANQILMQGAPLLVPCWSIFRGAKGEFEIIISPDDPTVYGIHFQHTNRLYIPMCEVARGWAGSVDEYWIEGGAEWAP